VGRVFTPQTPPLHGAGGGYVSCDPGPAPVRGPPALSSWRRPALLPRIWNGDPSGVWVGPGPERGQGQGMAKQTPLTRRLSGTGRGKGPGGRVFQGPVRPIMNSRWLGGLELRTPDVVPLWVASGDEYGATLEDMNAGGVYAPP